MSSAQPSEAPFPAATDNPALNWTRLRTDALATIRSLETPTGIEVPALPQSVSEFVERSSDPNFDYTELADIVESDAGLTCELLRFVNSARNGLQAPIRSVAQALAHLGIETSRTFLMAAGAKAATIGQKSRLLNQRVFWNESLQRGLFARALADSMKLDAGLCFLGGLLQDFLLPVLTNRFDKEYIRFMDGEGREGRDLCDWERETFGWDHAGAGACVAYEWRFPDDLLCALFYHHALQTTLHRTEVEFFNLFPVTCASLLPNQLEQSPRGVRELIQVDSRSNAIRLNALCDRVDCEHQEQAEGSVGGSSLRQRVDDERRRMSSETA